MEKLPLKDMAEKNQKQEAHSFHSGFVALVGPPNVGKSTLLNRIMGGHFSIVTEKPQTTRTSIRAIKNLPNAQIIFVDTPGMHHSEKAFNQLLVQSAEKAFREADLALCLISADKIENNNDLFMFSMAETTPEIPKVLAINKIDKVSEDSLEFLKKKVKERFSFDSVFPVSALSGKGVKILVESLAVLLPEGLPLFPQDMETDMTERFYASEVIREKIFSLTNKEIPYDIAVGIERFKEDTQKKMLIISAVIHVNRESQKRIIIGKKGGLIKEIGKLARKDLETFFGFHIYLELWVRVSRNWMKNKGMLKELGLTG
jgi:GTP-binding protein Era